VPGQGTIQFQSNAGIFQRPPYIDIKIRINRNSKKEK
jgi:hypothetical protein